MSGYEFVLNKIVSRSKPVASKRVDNNTYAELRVVDAAGSRATDLVTWQAVPAQLRAVAIRLHQTDIVTYRDEQTATCILSTGGWKTVTTKARINDWLPKGFAIGSVKGQWRLYLGRDGVVDWSTSVPFVDGITLKQLSVLNWYPVEGTYPDVSQEEQAATALKKLRKDARDYLLDGGTDEQVEQLVRSVLDAYDGEWPSYLEPKEWLTIVDNEGLPAAEWLSQYREAAE